MIQRSSQPEILDRPGNAPADLDRSLSLVADVNRRLGGLRALKRHLEPLLAGDHPVRILDVGTGNGGTLHELGAWASNAGRRWHMVGVDKSAQVIRLARRWENLPVLRADGLALPFADRSFDAVLCTLTLHHFPEDRAVRLVREMARVSRHLLLVNDLERHAVNYAGAMVLAATAWRRCPITRHDGPLSVLRSFTRPELVRIGLRAGLDGVRVRRHFPFRLVLEAKRSAHLD